MWGTLTTTSVIHPSFDCRFGRPKGENHLLQPGELAAMFGPAQGFELLRDDFMVIGDGRELCMFVARKLPTPSC